MPYPDPRVPSASAWSLASALAVYAEPLASGSRVVVFGDSELAMAQSLLDLGARTVHVFDPDSRRSERAAAAAPRGVAIRPLADDVDLRDGAFDLAVVPDIGALGDAADALRRLR